MTCTEPAPRIDAATLIHSRDYRVRQVVFLFYDLVVLLVNLAGFLAYRCLDARRG